jgi:hypothetical protein
LAKKRSKTSGPDTVKWRPWVAVIPGYYALKLKAI